MKKIGPPPFWLTATIFAAALLAASIRDDLTAAVATIGLLWIYTLALLLSRRER